MKLSVLKIILSFALVSMGFIVSAHQLHVPNITSMDLSYKNLDFAMNLYRKVASYHDKNIFFSPLSVSTSFAALSMATNGITHKEILKVLNLEQFELADQPDLIPRLFQLLQEDIVQNGTLQLDQSTALFILQQFELDRGFEERLKSFFHADIMPANFVDTKRTVDSINEYVKQKTANKVQEIISTLDPTTQLLLVNTIFFQGAWEIPFNANVTSDAPFHIDNYNIVQVPMMFVEDHFYTTEDESLDAKVLKLPYKAGVSMLILLPSKKADYTVIESEITAKKFLNWINHLQKTKLEVNLPKFNMERAYSLHNILPDMGLISLFTDSANLTRLSKDKSLRLSEVLHKAVIEVDETGTTAAAVTSIGITPYSLPRRFTVNRPFFFFIYHEETNSLLFMGRVIDPTKS